MRSNPSLEETKLGLVVAIHPVVRPNVRGDKVDGVALAQSIDVHALTFGAGERVRLDAFATHEETFGTDADEMISLVESFHQSAEVRRPLVKDVAAIVSGQARFVYQLVREDRRIILIRDVRERVRSRHDFRHERLERVSTLWRGEKVFASIRARFALFSRPSRVSRDAAVIVPIIRQRQDDANPSPLALV